MAKPDIFLSYNSLDRPAVQQIEKQLKARGFEVWFDQSRLVPGSRWMLEVEEALRSSGAAAVVLGRHGLSTWERREIRVILLEEAERGTPVIPILLPGAVPDKLPTFLKDHIWVDFREGISEQEMDRLAQGVTGKPREPSWNPPLPYRCMAQKPQGFVKRRKLDEIVDHLCIDTGQSAGQIGLCGPGGFGKTALAQAAAYHLGIRQTFPDGVLWTTMGDNLDNDQRHVKVRDVAWLWAREEPPAFGDTDAIAMHLRELLAGQRVLLVVDDVWQRADIEPFLSLGAESALLLTTRNRAVLPPECKSVHVGAMEIPEATELLGWRLPREESVSLESMAVRLGQWPLLLRLVNRQLQDLLHESTNLAYALSEINEALDQTNLTAFDQETDDARDLAVSRTLEASIQRLSARARMRFRELTVFPENIEIPLYIAERLWQLDRFPTKQFCLRLWDLSLLEKFDRSGGTIRVHSVVRSYLLEETKTAPPELHQRLLDNSCPPSGNWADLELEDEYFGRHLAYHLIAANQLDELEELLQDANFLQSRLAGSDIRPFLPSSYQHTTRESLRIKDYAGRFLISHLTDAGQLRKVRSLLQRLTVAPS